MALLLVLAAACANNEETPPHEDDQTPPEVTAPRPSGTLAAGTISTTLAVTTNEAASCKWDLSPATDFASMANAFTAGTNGTEHQAAVSGLADGTSYVYYVRCSDTAGNANASSTVISFSVASASDQTPPTITDGKPEGALAAGTTSATMSVKTNENATCKWDSDDAASYAEMANTFATTGGTLHNTPLSGLIDGESYTYAVRCQDNSGNANSSSTVIGFSVASDPSINGPRGKYLARLKKFADLAIEHGRDTHGPVKSPLFVDGLHVNSPHVPYQWTLPRDTVAATGFPKTSQSGNWPKAFPQDGQ